MVTKPRTPCYGCTDRVTCCHSKCQKYANYREKLDSYNQATKTVYMDWSNMAKPKKNKKRLSGYET